MTTASEAADRRSLGRALVVAGGVVGVGDLLLDGGWPVGLAAVGLLGSGAYLWVRHQPPERGGRERSRAARRAGVR